jgi:hypothetical protein
VVKRKKRLDNTCDPEKTHQPGYEKEHLPRSYFCPGKVTLGKYHAYNQEDSEPHELETLKS